MVEKRKPGRPRKDETPEPPVQRSAESKFRLERARVLVVRGTPRVAIQKKLHLTDEEMRELNSWRRSQ